jgi:diguanylate cyclase (GGDEF)-like protein
MLPQSFAAYLAKIRVVTIILMVHLCPYCAVKGDPDKKPVAKELSPGTVLTERRSRKYLEQNRTLLQILESNDSISVWLAGHKASKTDAIITFVDELSAGDRESLQRRSHLVVGVYDDLLEKITQLKKENASLRSLTLTDALTGLYNTRFFSMQLDIEIARTRRTGQPSSLMMIDLDNFKLLNDTLGHIQGNRFLMRTSSTLREQLRPTDIVCRYGGDEFAVIMPATDLFDAVRIANRLQQAIAVIPLKKVLPISASIGVAEYSAGSRGGSDEFVHQADMALYKAKKNGKNQVFYEGKPEKTVELDAVSAQERLSLGRTPRKKYDDACSRIRGGNGVGNMGRTAAKKGSS